jgi:hypothetical protein
MLYALMWLSVCLCISHFQRFDLIYRFLYERYAIRGHPVLIHVIGP